MPSGRVVTNTFARYLILCILDKKSSGICWYYVTSIYIVDLFHFHWRGLKWIRHHFMKTRLTRHDRNTAYQLYPAILHVKTTLWYPQFVMLKNTSVHWTTSKSRVDTIQLLSGNNTSSVTTFHHKLVTTVYELYSSFIYQWKWLSLC